MNPILIDIQQENPGYDQFIGSWVCPGKLNIVIDVGPSNSINRLIGALDAMNMERVDFVLLTHIHIDHSGGLAEFLEQFPMARVICHERAVRHLTDSSRLWAGSRKVLGEVADAYGPLKPVEKGKLISHAEAQIQDLEIIETPGHAVHHISFSYKGYLFAGEAGGNYFLFRDHEYLRPATPPVFLLEDCLNSVDRLLEKEDQPICYAHFGRADSSHIYLKRFRGQLIRWEEIIGDFVYEGDEKVVERCMARLFEKDPDLKAFEFMEVDDQKRERFLMANSIKGYLEFLKNRK